jgi:hypothetical protein
LVALSFDPALLKKNNFQIYCLSYKKVKYHGFVERQNVENYLSLGTENAIVISLDVPKHQEFFVCAVIARDQSLLERATEYATILASIDQHYKPIKRGTKTHQQEGKMYPFGYRGERLLTNYGAYIRQKQSVRNPEAYKTFSANTEAICAHYFKMMEYYFPTLAAQFNNLCQNYHSPGITNSHAANLFVAFNFTSAAHVDVMDATYAFGVWYDQGDGSNSDSTFAFPQFRVTVHLHHGIASMWNAEKALHCTTQASLPHEKLRIRTVIQTNKSLNTKARKFWESQH